MTTMPEHKIDFWCRCPWCSKARFGRLRAKCDALEAIVRAMPDDMDTADTLPRILFVDRS